MKKLYIICLFILFLLSGCKSSILDDPSTVINYQITEQAHVKLTIENSYNTIIATLVDEDLNAGSYRVPFNVTDLSEGIYYYTLEVRGLKTDNYSKTTHEILIVK